MMNERKYGRALRFINKFFIFFLMVAFVITCCTTLFVTLLMESLGAEFSAEEIGKAAKLTFVNVLLLSLIFTLIDGVRRYFTVHRPIKRITEGIELITRGDFSVRIPTLPTRYGHESFNEIIEGINKMTEELSGTETLRSDFIANVSHELKTPLAVIGNYARMLKDSTLDGKRREEYAEEISLASTRLAQLITNILKLNKLENQKLTVQKTEYDLTEQLCECILGFESAWEGKEIVMDINLDDGIIAYSDREMMSIVFNNLISNAIKFTDTGGTVSISCEREGGLCVVKIKDTGCGISKEVGAKIFDKFYQADTSRATLGNGLGLALVKRVLDLTQSEITVDSEIGVGSTFTVKLDGGTTDGKL